jgi:signal transduction histidine kinase
MPALQAVLDGLPFGACLVRGLAVLGANQRLADLIARPLAEVASAPNLAAFAAPEERERATTRSAARARGESVIDDYELWAQLPSGERTLLRVMVSPFPAAGPGVSLAAFTSERERDRPSALIRGFSDAAMAVRGTPEEILGTLRARLSALGLSVLVAATPGEVLGEVQADGALEWLLTALKRRAGSLPLAALPLAALPLAEAARRSTQPIRVDDLGAVVAQALRRPRAEVPLEAGLAGMAAVVPVDGAPAYLLIAAGRELDPGVASAFTLLARQVGTAIETSRRLRELDRSNRELTAVNHVARASATLGSAQALPAALEWLATAVPVDAVALLRREGGELLLQVNSGFPESWVARATRSQIGAGSPWGEAVSQRLPRLFAEATEGDSVALPLQVSEAVLGVLVVSRPGRPLGVEELRMLTSVAAQLAISLQNSLLFQQTERRVAELSLLLELGRAVGGSLDQGEILAKGASVAVRVLRSSAAYVFLAEGTPQPRALRAAAFSDPLRPGLANLELPLDVPSLTALAFRTGKPQLSNATGVDPRIDGVLNTLFGCKSSLAVPLLSHDKPLGVLLLIERSNDRSFGDEDTRVASHAAQLLAASVDNAGLYAEQRQRAEEMELVNGVSSSLTGALEVEPLVQEAAEKLRRLLAASGCSILRYDEERKVLCAPTAGGLRAETSAVTYSLGSPSAAATALRERRIVRSDDVGSPPVAGAATLRRRRSVMVIPLIARDQPQGVVVIDDVKPDRVFDATEIERATAVAGQIAMAMLSAGLFEKLRRSYRELETAQAALLEQERLAALGALSASVAHEVRNPLGVIFNSLGSLRKLLKQEGNVGLLLGIIQEEADRLNAMVGDLLDFARPLRPTLTPVPLRPLVEDALDAARTRTPGADEGKRPARAGQLEGPLELDLRIPPGLTLMADARLLRQALVNLLLNALQAMPKGGVLSVHAEMQTGLGNPQARILVRDTGPGVPPEQRANVFQPFFTTKATGTGLGLAVVRRIIEGHGGRINLLEREEGGAEFELLLPVQG